MKPAISPVLRVGVHAALVAMIAAAALGGCDGGDQVSDPITSQTALGELTGVYDLNTLIQSSDPAWGIEAGTSQTAVLTVAQKRGVPQLTGTFAEFRVVGQTSPVNAGTLAGGINSNGTVVIELISAGSATSNWRGQGTITSGQIVGTFFSGGHISGTFTAARRN